MIIVANFTADFLSAFDICVVTVALPTVVQDLGGNDFIWVGSAYALAGSAIVPMCGGLVSIWGRKPILLSLMTLFAIGSAVAGSAKTMNALIIGRAFQGFGGCGALTVTEIIYADLIPLAQRGVMQGMASVVWAFATGLGPPLGGILANAGAWRWIFYLNLPIFAVAIALEIIFLHNTPPQATVAQKLRRMDWLGSLIVVGGSAAVVLALSWGGARFAWSAPQTLVPLILGVVALLCFLLFERHVPKEPIVSYYLILRSSRTVYIGTSIHGMVQYVALYYLPVYMQAVKLTSPTRAGVYLLGYAMFITPAAMVCGVSIMVMNRYLPQNYIGWVLIVAGCGVFAILDVNSSKATIVCVQFLLGMGIGMGWTMTQFPILASLPSYANNAHALSFFTFVRNLSQTMGIAIGGTILQNQLQHRLPASYIAQLPSGVAFAYTAIPSLPSLPPDLQLQVRQAFSDSLRLLWLIMIGVSGIGLVSVLFMREIPMQNVVDEQWAIEKKDGKGAARSDSHDAEKNSF
ncbi:iron permease [Cytidiella melzeri]|nr:iron permease [Cytidiella melzeri]